MKKEITLSVRKKRERERKRTLRKNCPSNGLILNERRSSQIFFVYKRILGDFSWETYYDVNIFVILFFTATLFSLLRIYCPLLFFFCCDWCRFVPTSNGEFIFKMFANFWSPCFAINSPKVTTICQFLVILHISFFPLLSLSIPFLNHHSERSLKFCSQLTSLIGKRDKHGW